MTEKTVKLTFVKSENGEHITVKKDGGFTPADVAKLTKAVEELFDSDSVVEDEIELEDGEVEENRGEESFVDRVNREAAARVAETKKDQTTPPAGRGQGAGRVAAGVGITKEGTVDRRTLKGSPENPDPKQQKVAKEISQQQH